MLYVAVFIYPCLFFLQWLCIWKGLWSPSRSKWS